MLEIVPDDDGIGICVEWGTAATLDPELGSATQLFDLTSVYFSNLFVSAM